MVLKRILSLVLWNIANIAMEQVLRMDRLGNASFAMDLEDKLI